MEKKIFEMVDDGRRTDDGPWLYYNITNEPKGSGELKTNLLYIMVHNYTTGHIKIIPVCNLKKLQLFGIAYMRLVVFKHDLHTCGWWFESHDRQTLFPFPFYFLILHFTIIVDIFKTFL